MDPFMRGVYRLAESLDNPDDLRHFADRWNLLDDPIIQQRLRFLTHNEEQATLDSERETSPVRDDNRQDITQAVPQIPYSIRQTGEKTIKKFKATERTFQITFNEQWMGRSLVELHENLKQMFETVLTPIVSSLSPNDKIRIVMHHPNIDKPIIYAMRPVSYFDIGDLMDSIQNVLNSKQDLTLSEQVTIDVGTIEMPKGGAVKRITAIRGLGNSLEKKRSCVFINNPDDNLCLARAIAVSFCHKYKSVNAQIPTDCDEIDYALNHRVVSEKYYNEVRRSNRLEQKRFALKLHEFSGVSSAWQGTLNDIEQYERALDVNIFVVSSSLGNKFIRVCDDEDDRPPKDRLFLYLDDSDQYAPHFHSIVSIAGIFGQSYFCQQCLKPYASKNTHACRKGPCFVCKDTNCLFVDWYSCSDCNIDARSKACYDRHKDNGQCDKYFKCPICSRVLVRKKRHPEEHICGEWMCPSCEDYVVGQHLCYQRIPPKKRKATDKFMYFDFEARQDELYECEYGYTPVSDQPCNDCSTNNIELCSHSRKCKNCSSRFCGQNQHVANYVVVQKTCSNCSNNDCEPDSRCDSCGTRCSKCGAWDKKQNVFKFKPCDGSCGLRETVFIGDTVEKDFGSFLFSEQHRDFTVLAHNGRGYDFYFLLSYLISHSIFPDSILYQGSKILYFHVGRGLNITFKDSLSFLPMKLSAMPKAFGFKEMSKGYFPHFFNTKANQAYVGPYPDPRYYGLDAMSTAERNNFMQWYATKESCTFDFRVEMHTYCRSDVQILRQACTRFRNLVIDVTGGPEKGVDCFDYITIASTCMGVFKRKFLTESWRYQIDEGEWLDVRVKDEEITILLDGEWVPIGELDTRGMTVTAKHFVSSPLARVPSCGYVSRTNYSRNSIAWLCWLIEDGRFSNIRHALNGSGEIIIPETNYRVDGFADAPAGDDCKGYALEYLGCYWHACPTCYPNDRRQGKDSNTKLSFAERYEMTKHREKEIKRLGYEYISIWEHEFLEQVTNVEEIKQFVNSLDIQDRLDPRDSFFGGRTNGTTLYHKATGSEEIRYVDFTSLYPYVQKYSKFPLGHPTIITDDFGQLSEYFGLAKVKVLPPRRLLHPVLPYRHAKKLYFPLCTLCCDSMNQDPCKHSDDQRCLVGTWCTPELNKALEKGYRIVKIYEVYHFENTCQFNKACCNNGLFSEYVDMFLKLKQEASGWPNWCQSNEDREKYVQGYLQHESIQLDQEKIGSNPGLRSLAKLMLNNLWGKFAFNLAKTAQVSFHHTGQPEKLYKDLCDKTKNITDFGIINESTLQLSWCHASENMPDHADINIFIATFTTCWARLKLYELLEQLQDRVLYFDTDSVVYVQEPCLPELPLGDYLGQLTNEVGANTYISEFACTGPKSYAYVTTDGSSSCKVKGFSLNHANSQLINFESMKQVLLEDRERIISVTNPSKISRDKRKRKIYSVQESKRFKLVYSKRVLHNDFTTTPYGF